jgi:hypothetical protein
MCLFSFAVMLFLAHFETVSKVASIQILVRFVQVTFMMSFYELSWQGGHAKKWLHKAGAPQTINNLPYSKDIFAMEWTSIYKAVSYLMPAMYFPAFAETAALGCDTENPSFADWSIVVVLGLPTLIVGGRWLMWARKYRPQYSLSGAVVMVKSAWNERGMKHSTRHGQNKGAAVAKTNNGPQIGQHELERMRGGVVGLFVMLLPFLLRHALKVVNCDETTVGVACMPDTFFKMVGSAAIWFALIGLGVLFLNGNPKSGYAYFLTKSKNQTQKKWEFFVQFRQCVIVSTLFVSQNGVMQAGLGLTVLLGMLALHTFNEPYKDRRSNLLEKMCLLANVCMLFLGTIASTGTLPTENMRDIAQSFGEGLLFISMGVGVYTIAVEMKDRVQLNRRKQGLQPLSFKYCQDNKTKQKADRAWKLADMANKDAQKARKKTLVPLEAPLKADEAGVKLEDGISSTEKDEVQAKAGVAAESAQLAEVAWAESNRATEESVQAKARAEAARHSKVSAEANAKEAKAAKETAEKAAKEAAEGRPVIVAALRDAGASVSQDDVADFLLSQFGAKVEAEAQHGEQSVEDFVRACWEEAQKPPDENPTGAVAEKEAAAEAARTTLIAAQEEVNMLGLAAQTAAERAKTTAMEAKAAETKAKKAQAKAKADREAKTKAEKAQNEKKARTARMEQERVENAQTLQTAMAKSDRLRKAAAKAEIEVDAQKDPDAVLADFVGELMDAVVPKGRSKNSAAGPHSVNEDAFLVLNLDQEMKAVGEPGRMPESVLHELRDRYGVKTASGTYAKMFPLAEIEQLLFSHAALKRNLIRVHKSLFAHWKYMSSTELYSSAMHDSFLNDTDLRKDVVRVLSAAPPWYLKNVPAIARDRIIGILAAETTTRGSRIFRKANDLSEAEFDNEAAWNYIVEAIEDSDVYTDPPNATGGVPDTGPAAMAAEVADDEMFQAGGSLAAFATQANQSGEENSGTTTSARKLTSRGKSTASATDQCRVLNWGRRCLGRKVKVNDANVWGGPPLDYQFEYRISPEDEWQTARPEYHFEEGHKRRAIQSIWVRVCMTRRKSTMVGARAAMKMIKFARRASATVAARRLSATGGGSEGSVSAPSTAGAQPTQAFHSAFDAFENDEGLRASLLSKLCDRLNAAVIHGSGKLNEFALGKAIEPVVNFSSANSTAKTDGGNGGRNSGDFEIRPLQVKISSTPVHGAVAGQPEPQPGNAGGFYIRLDFAGGLLDDFTGKFDTEDMLDDEKHAQFPVQNDEEGGDGSQTHCRRSIQLAEAVRNALSPCNVETEGLLSQTAGMDLDLLLHNRSTFISDVESMTAGVYQMRVDWRYSDGDGAGVFGQFDTLGDMQRLCYMWTERVGRARIDNASSWFTHKEAYVRQNDYVDRRQLLIDWMMHPDTEADLVDTMHKSVAMLISEYQKMISVQKSSISELMRCATCTQAVRKGHFISSVFTESGLAAIATGADVQLEATLLGGPVGAACFAGDILRFKVDLHNCFGAQVLHPSKKTVWELYLVPVGRSRSSDVDEDSIMFLSIQAEGNTTAIECAVPRSLRQGLYRLEVDIFKKPLRWSEHPTATLANGLNCPAVSISAVGDQQVELAVLPESQKTNCSRILWATSAAVGDLVEIEYTAPIPTNNWVHQYRIMKAIRAPEEKGADIKVAWELDRPLEPFEADGDLKAVCIVNTGSQVLVQQELRPMGTVTWKTRGKRSTKPSAIFVPAIPDREKVPGAVGASASVTAAGKVVASDLHCGSLHLFRNVDRAHVLVHGAVVMCKLYRARMVIHGVDGDTSSSESEDEEEKTESEAETAQPNKVKKCLVRTAKKCKRKEVRWDVIHELSAKLVATASTGTFMSGDASETCEQLLTDRVVAHRGAKGQQVATPMFTYALETMAVVSRADNSDSDHDAEGGDVPQDDHVEGAKEQSKSDRTLIKQQELEQAANALDPNRVQEDSGIKFMRLALPEAASSQDADAPAALGLPIDVNIDVSAAYDHAMEEYDNLPQYKMQFFIMGKFSRIVLVNLNFEIVNLSF